MKIDLKSPAIRYRGLFLLLTIALFSVLATPWAQRLFVSPFTSVLVHACAFLIGLFDHGVEAVADVLRFTDGHGAVQVLAGCNAVEVCALLTAAIVAFPGKIRYGLIGAAAGVVALQTINLLRIISLLYLSRGSQEVFEFFHNYVWDALIGLEGLLLFFWTRRQSRQEPAGTPEEVARRRFGLWAGLCLVLLLPLWWMWDADVVVGLLRPVVGLVLGLLGLTGRITVVDGGDWSIGTPLTRAGQALDDPVTKENLCRLMLGFPLAAAILIAPPRPSRPWRAVGISIVVLSLIFAVCVAMTVWGELAPMLSPDLASPGRVLTIRPDQPPLHPFAAQVVIVGRYVAQSIAPLLTALLLWATLNPAALRALAAEFTDQGLKFSVNQAKAGMHGFGMQWVLPINTSFESAFEINARP